MGVARDFSHWIEWGIARDFCNDELLAGFAVVWFSKFGDSTHFPHYFSLLKIVLPT